jgi:hypothetical protein
VRQPVEERGKQEAAMQEVTVYRWDYDKNTRFPIGVVLERRNIERGSNYIDLLRLARRRFEVNAPGAGHIFIGLSHIRRRILPERTSDRSAG